MSEDGPKPDPAPTVDPEEVESGKSASDGPFPDDTVDQYPAREEEGSAHGGTASVGPGSKKRIGPYEIQGEIGRGGMGIVYKAFHPALKRTVALKVLIAGEDASEEAIKRFRREAEAVAKLGHHPHIVPVYDIGAEGRRHYFAMHFVEGKPLDHLIDDAEITPKHAAEITKKIAEALHHAHQNGVLHRDVKPANVLMAFTKLEGEPPGEPKSEITDPKSKIPTKSQIPNLNDTGSGRSGFAGGASGESGSEPMLTDFGLAKDVESRSRFTVSGAVLGTPNYMPPEQAEGRVEDIGPRSDLFSLGATLYEMLAMHPPFEGKTIPMVIQKVVLVDPAPPRKVNPGIDGDLETICLKCLEKDPARRYGSAKELEKDLERYLKSEPILARPPSLSGRIARKIRRNRGISVILLLLVLVLAGGSVAGAFLLGKLSQERKEGESTREEKGKVEEALEKEVNISRVLMGGYMKLGDLASELKMHFAGSEKSLERKRTVYRKNEGRVEAFCASIDTDDASQAALLALKGWLKHLGGFDEEAALLFERAREKDREIGWGYLFEAMVHLSKYIVEQPMPPMKSDTGEVLYSRAPAESEVLAHARKRFESLATQAAKARIWGEAGEKVREVLSGLAGMNLGDLDAAESALTKALELPEMGWVEVELLYARVRVRYLAKKIDSTLADVALGLKKAPGNPEFTRFEGAVYSLRGFQKMQKRENPMGDLHKAVGAYDQTLRRDPDIGVAYSGRAYARMRQGLWTARKGGDPRDYFNMALADMDEILKRAKGSKENYVQMRGIFLFRIAEWEADHGLDATETYRKAIAYFTEALHLNPEYVNAAQARAVAFRCLGDAAVRRGEDPREYLRQAIAALNVAQGMDPDFVATYITRAQAFIGIGEWEASQGLDPLRAYRAALADVEEALRLDSEYVEVHLIRGKVYRKVAEWKAVKRLDPEPDLQRAFDLYNEVLAANPKNAAALAERGNLRYKLATLPPRTGRSPPESLEDAIADLDRALELEPEMVFAYSRRAMVHWTKGGWENQNRSDPRESYRKALSDFENVVKRNPEVVSVHLDRGRVFRTLALWEDDHGKDPRPTIKEGLAAVTEGIERSPTTLKLLNIRSDLYQIRAMWESLNAIDPRPSYGKAIEDVNRGIRMKPDLPNVHRSLANLHGKVGEWSAGQGLHADTDFKKALDAYEKALERDPAQWPALHSRASLYLKLGFFEEALADLEKVGRLTQGRVRDLPTLIAQARQGMQTMPFASSAAEAWFEGGEGRHERAAVLYEEALSRARKSGAFEEESLKPFLRAYRIRLAGSLFAPLASAPGEKRAVIEKKILENLRGALSLGWKDLAFLKESETFASIRDLPEFKALLAE
ncbi:MAG: protein kinase domain-containing protein, partial [Planctomycetota bacterium]